MKDKGNMKQEKAGRTFRPRCRSDICERGEGGREKGGGWGLGKLSRGRDRLSVRRVLHGAGTVQPWSLCQTQSWMEGGQGESGLAMTSAHRMVERLKAVRHHLLFYSGEGSGRSTPPTTMDATCSLLTLFYSLDKVIF